MEATTEIITNLKEIEKDLDEGLKNAGTSTNDSTAIAQNLAPVKPGLNLGHPVVKLFCKLKNNVQFKMVTKNVPEDIREKLQRFNEVKDAEIVVYKTALDQYGTEYLSPEIIEMFNKYANSPLAPLIEFEIEKFNLMQAEVRILLKNKEEVR